MDGRVIEDEARHHSSICNAVQLVGNRLCKDGGYFDFIWEFDISNHLASRELVHLIYDNSCV